jgi:ATP-binding cassette subfamily B multidrug efflux pump
LFTASIFRPMMDLIYSIGLALLVWFGGHDVVSGTIQLGVLYAFVDYLGRFFQPINDLTEKYTIMQSAMASSERIFQLMDQKPAITNAENPVAVDRFKGEIQFKNVWFAYNPGEWILKDISFTIKPGEMVAFVGATGAGKSSIINLLSRFYDIQKGTITIDGIDIRQMDLYQLRRNIGVVLQDVFLFSGDIRSNIRLNNESITDEEIEQVARYVNAHEFIEKLPNKYDEVVQERGSTLSSGQRQLLSFARTLAFNPSILVLDEATSNIDTETELLIQEALKKLTHNRTTIVIAHRLSTIQHADKIIVLHKGEIKEMGNHQELLSKKGLYYKLYELQYKEDFKKNYYKEALSNM